MLLGGSSVNVSPSVVRVVRLATAGKDIVLLPMTVPGAADVESTSVVADDCVGNDGKKVKVCPSVVKVVGAVTEGREIVLLPPMIITRELEMIVCPSDPVYVVGSSPPGADVIGWNVKVSPSVVIVVGVVIEGTVMVLLPPIIKTPELETTTAPSGRVKVDNSSLSGEVVLG